MNTVYTIAFDGHDFLMVYNPKRKGWEMPGGSMEDNENAADAAFREYLEESGHEISVIAVKATDDCYVCAAALGAKIRDGEFISALFTELPDELAFDRSEYDEVIEWARSVTEKK